MANKQQTAVEWLEDKFDKFLSYYEGHYKAEPYSIVEFSNDIFEAKEMEKQQIINAFQAGDGDAYNTDTTKDWAEHYYNERYGNKS